MCTKKPFSLVLLTIGIALDFALHGGIVIARSASATTNDASATSLRSDHHIVSFVHQKHLKAASKQQDNLVNFDFENIRNDVNGSQTAFERLTEELDMTLKTNDLFNRKGDSQKRNGSKVERYQRLQQTDDSTDTKQNTLMDMNALFEDNKHHESPDGNANATMWQRNKQSIPVLETVRHFVNSVREGALNHTIPNRNHNHHHNLIDSAHNNAAMGANSDSGGVVSHNKPTNKSEENPAIETEEERVHTEESTEFKLLEVLGSFGSIFWNFLMSIQKFFAASSGGASSSSSSQASASSSGGGAR